MAKKVRLTIMEFVLTLSLITSFILIVNSCEQKGGYGPAGISMGAVNGHVYLSGSLKPLANVIVSCGGQVDTTGKSGHYSLGNIAVGAQDISAINSYYQTYTSKVNIRGNEITTFDIFLYYSN